MSESKKVHVGVMVVCHRQARRSSRDAAGRHDPWGLSAVVTDLRAHMVSRSGFRLFRATAEHAANMRRAGLDRGRPRENLYEV